MLRANDVLLLKFLNLFFRTNILIMDYNLIIFRSKVCNDITATSVDGRETNRLILSPGEGSCHGGDEEAVDIKHEPIEPYVEYSVSFCDYSFSVYFLIYSFDSIVFYVSPSCMSQSLFIGNDFIFFFIQRYLTISRLHQRSLMKEILRDQIQAK